MAEIDIDGVTYDVYSDLETADEYLAASVNTTNWDALDDDGKGKLLVTSSRILDRQSWKGAVAQTSPKQPLAWPRINTGVTGVEDDEIPDDIVNASIELALALADGSDVQTAQNQAQKIEQLKAGSVSLKFFRGADGTPLRFPLPVQELIRKYLAGSVTSLVGKATGTDGTSSTDEDFGLSNPL